MLLSTDTETCQQLVKTTKSMIEHYSMTAWLFQGPWVRNVCSSETTVWVLSVGGGWIVIKWKLIISTLTSGKHKQEGLSNVLDAYIQKQFVILVTIIWKDLLTNNKKECQQKGKLLGSCELVIISYKHFIFVLHTILYLQLVQDKIRLGHSQNQIFSTKHVSQRWPSLQNAI